MPKTVVHVNVARILLVVGGIALGWKYLNTLSGADEVTKRELINAISSTISFAKWRI